VPATDADRRSAIDRAVNSREEPAQYAGLARARVGPVAVDSLASGARYAVGVDVGHDHVRMILTDLIGTTLWDRGVPLSVDGDPKRALDTAAKLIDGAIGETGVSRSCVLGLGLGIACPVGTNGELHADGIMPGWVGMRPANELAERTGLATRLINDANAGALAESRFGAARSCANAVYLRLSSGIGAGLVRDGRVLLGSGGFAGEIGHVTVEPHGDLCRCGNRGCLETVATPPALAALLSRSKGRPITPTELTDLISRRDPDALRAIENAANAVGRALTFTTMLFNPGLIVIGGDLSIAGPSLLDPIRCTLTRNNTSRPLRIVASTLGDSAGVRGAAALVLDGVRERLA
jgi:predicted NBD/HSP70 family sugar kinase